MNLWLVIAVGLGVVAVLIVPAAVTEWRNTRAMADTTWITGYEEPALQPDPVPDWSDTAEVEVPGLDPLPRKRRVSGAGRKLARTLALRDGPMAWAWTDTGPAARPAAGPWAAWA